MSDMWRCHVQLISRIRSKGVALVWIPAMEAENDKQTIPIELVPEKIKQGERFFITCTLDPKNFQVAPLENKKEE